MCPADRYAMTAKAEIAGLRVKRAFQDPSLLWLDARKASARSMASSMAALAGFSGRLGSSATARAATKVNAKSAKMSLDISNSNGNLPSDRTEACKLVPTLITVCVHVSRGWRSFFVGQLLEIQLDHTAIVVAE